MADEPKKPRNIKDLKQRLGRPGAATAPAGAPVPMGGAPIPAAPPGIAAPPFLRQPEPEVQRPSDPFAAGPATAGPREVRLVIDEKPVDDAEVGRGRTGARFAMIGVGLIVGLLLGWAVGSLLRDRNLYNVALRDGKDIYNTVQSSTDRVNEAKRYVDAAIEAATGGPGKQPSVDYQAISKLKLLERPFDANAFANRHYGAFRGNTVNDLFDYYNNVLLMWNKFDQLASRTSESRRAALDEAAAAAGNVTIPTGAVPSWETIGEGDDAVTQLMLGLVFVQPSEEEPDGDDPPPVRVSSTLRGAAAEKVLYTNQDLSEDPTQYVILIDGRRSVGVLGQQASLFAEYQRDLIELQALINRTIEVQGRLETGLGEIASMEELFVPF